MARVKSMDVAIQRIAACLPRVRVRKEGRVYHIRARGGGAPAMDTQKSKAEALAFLADIARFDLLAEEIREEVGWVGSVPQKGLSGWEDYALNWLVVS